MNIILATGNSHKAREFERLLGSEIKTTSDYAIELTAEENGETFEQNAAIKAREAWAKLRDAGVDLRDTLVIADDSGICADALGGAPGIYSARYCAGSDHDRMMFLLEKMEQQENSKANAGQHANRKAHYVCVLCAIDENEKISYYRGELHGELVRSPLDGGRGFGYDPIFVPEGYDTTVAMLSDEEKDRLSHRGKAARELLKQPAQ